MAAADGLEFHFDRVRSANTFDAHRLTHLAAAHGRPRPRRHPVELASAVSKTD